MTATAVVSAVAIQDTAEGTSPYVVALPRTAVANELIVVGVTADGAGPSEIATPAGYPQVTIKEDTTNSYTYVKVAAGGETSVSFTTTNDFSHCVACVAIVTGADTSTPVAASVVVSDDPIQTIAASVANTAPNQLGFYFEAMKLDPLYSATPTTPTGWTQRGTVNGEFGFSQASFGTKDLSTTVTTQGVTVNMDQVGRVHLHLLIINPAPDVGGGSQAATFTVGVDARVTVVVGGASNLGGSALPLTLPFILGAPAGGGTGTPPASYQTAAFQVQAAFGKTATATLVETDWVTLTNVTNINVNRPSSRNLGVLVRYQAGTCQVTLDNQDRRYDPSNTASPYNGQLLPMTPIRVRVYVSGVWYPLFRGFADSWPVAYTQAGKTASTSLTATDGIKMLSRFNGPEQPEQGGSESSGQRVARVLSNAGWTGPTSIDTGVATLLPTTLAQPAWTELLLVADSERGDIFIAADGTLTFLQLTHRALNTRSNTPQAIWGDTVGEQHYSNPSISYDDKQIVNQVSIANTGGAQQSSTDATSAAQYGTLSLNRTDFVLENDSAALSYANALVAQLKDPVIRFEGVTYTPGSAVEQAGAAPAVFGVEFGDRWTVRFSPPGGGTRIIRDVWVVGVSYTATQSTFQASFTFQPIDSRVNLGWTWDSPTLAIWDTSAWPY